MSSRSLGFRFHTIYPTDDRPTPLTSDGGTRPHRQHILPPDPTMQPMSSLDRAQNSKQTVGPGSGNMVCPVPLARAGLWDAAQLAAPSPTPLPIPPPTPPSTHPATCAVASPTCTVRIIIHRASDLTTHKLFPLSANPYVLSTVHASSTGGNPARPELTHRTPTARRTSSPQWDDKWIVTNVPLSGFTLRCRIFHETLTDRDKLLGEAVIRLSDLSVPVCGPASDSVATATGYESGSDSPLHSADFDPDVDLEKVPSRPASITETSSWTAEGGRELLVHNFTRSRRSGLSSMCMGARPPKPLRLWVGIRILSWSDRPHGQMCTLGPTGWIRHSSPFFGRLTGTTVNRFEADDLAGATKFGADGRNSFLHSDCEHDDSGRVQLWRPLSTAGNDQPRNQKRQEKTMFDFQTTEMQLQGPVPPNLHYHYDELRPLVLSLFSSTGVRGKLLNLAMRQEHVRLYRFDRSTQSARFAPTSREATAAFLRLVHYADSGRLFSYVLTRDAVLRFGQTGTSLAMRALGKHAMHAHMAEHVAFAGEFWLRRRSGSRRSASPADPARFQLVIDNCSGTYRPDLDGLPLLRAFLARNLPGLDICAMSYADPALARLKAEHRAGRTVSVAVGPPPLPPKIPPDQQALAGLCPRPRVKSAPALADSRTWHIFRRHNFLTSHRQHAHSMRIINRSLYRQTAGSQ